MIMPPQHALDESNDSKFDMKYVGANTVPYLMFHKLNYIWITMCEMHMYYASEK